MSTAEDPNGLLGINDNTIEEELALSPEQGWGDETVEIYELEDETNQFEEGDFSADISQIRNEEGELVFDPAIDAFVEESGEEFELVIACAENEDEGVDDDDYYVTVNTIVSGSNTAVEFERETDDSVQIRCAGEMPDQPPFFDVEIDGTNSPIEGGEALEIDAEVTNRGDETDTQDIRLEIDGTEVDRIEGVTLGPDDEAMELLKWENAKEGERDVTIRSDDDKTTRTVTIGDATLVTAVAEDEFGNNDETITAFEIYTDEGVYEFEIHLETSGGGSDEWEQKEVTIDEETFELTDEAANDIAVDMVEQDLLLSETYEDAVDDEETLIEVRDSLDTDSEVQNKENTGQGNPIDLEIEIE
ncbi:hypothetical protein [Natronococcus pandeyae]|uniref:hypothetical protein n=1 Tax=Natronococcus pandeyae TaxID=2055836 RepID=UPI0011E8713E|nr:hypothetical protein [Natronococcus pandeyae]